MLLVFVSLILGAFSVWFNKNLGVSIKHLADFVGEMKSQHYSIDMPDDLPGSSELGEISFNMRRMVTALRFGDAAFSKGDKSKELQNCVEVGAPLLLSGFYFADSFLTSG